MNIIDNRTKPLVVLDSLNPGDILEWDGIICIKLNYDPSKNKGMLRIVALKSGELFNLHSTTSVILLNAKLIIS